MSESCLTREEIRTKSRDGAMEDVDGRRHITKASMATTRSGLVMQSCPKTRSRLIVDAAQTQSSRLPK